MNYKRFTVTDFLSDEHFQNWIIEPDEKMDNFWNKWLDRNPDKRNTVEEAKKVLLNIKFKEDFPTAEQVREALEKNLSKINSLNEGNGEQAKVVKMNSFRNLRRIAAVFIGVLLIGGVAFYFNWKSATIRVATNYGEIKTIMLPDGSKITLNAHSSVSYLKHWRSSIARKVTLEGEAFFQVKHLNENQNRIKESERFIVSTSDLNVEVLGTTFDVRNRRGETNVILETGKVRVAFNNANQKDITMLPGEMIAYQPLTNELHRSVTDPVLETSWKDRKLILNNATVNTIIQYLEDNYGYKVVLRDTAIGNKKMEGTLLLDNFQDILFVLSTSLDIKIEKKDSTLIFSKMPSAR
jgi:ferric-dicitrate binding protein FerR (iron transport regulator)